MATIEVDSEFKFHNVGQGLFYTGVVATSRASFRFIYDVGSDNQTAIDQAVDDYTGDVSSVDILFISHLHKDHTSGINKLLDNISVKHVYLPYLGVGERLLLAVMYPKENEWYYRFLQDPATFLLERHVEVVTFIELDDNNPFRRGSSEPPRRDNDTREDFPLEIENRLDDLGEQRQEEILSVESRHWDDYLSKGLVKFKTHHGYLTVFGVWLFSLFNYHLPSKAVLEFSNCANRALGSLDLKSAITNKNARGRLKECYDNVKKRLKNDFNNTSLILYHQPLSGYSISTIDFPIYCMYNLIFCHRWCRNRIVEYLYTHQKRFGQLLTADINLNVDFQQIYKHFHIYFDNIFLIQVPHHGSRKNWNDELLSMVPRPSWWIFSAGVKNRYRHPHPGIFLEIAENHHFGYWVNERYNFFAQSKIYWP